MPGQQEGQKGVDQLTVVGKEQLLDFLEGIQDIIKIFLLYLVIC